MSGLDESGFRAAVEAATDGLAITDSAGDYVYLNQAHLEMFGYLREELIGASWRTLYTDDEARRLEREAIPTMLERGSWRGEAVGRHRGGRSVYQEVVLSSHPNGGIICATRDVSHRREQERRTRLLEARLRLAERSELLFSVHSSLAHDFGNLIAAIDGFARLIRQSPQAITLNQPRVDAILKATEQAFDLIRSTAPSDHDNLGIGALDLADLLDTIIGIARSLAPDSLNIVVDLGCERPVVLANETLAARSFLNVIKNAVEATSQSGHVTVRLQSRASPPLAGAVVRSLGPDLPDYRWAVEIEDDGEGMSEDRLASILEIRFTTKTGPMGRGLGLESVIGLAETGLVAVEIQTAEGCGTRFVFRFVDADASGDERPLPKFSMAPEDQKRRVFVVDDNELVANMLSQTLAAAGFEAAYDTSGESAIVRNAAHFDAVVTDLRMPEMDGYELSTRLRAVRPSLPIIVYSGQGGHISQSSMFNVVLSKPVDPAELVEAVRSVTSSNIENPLLRLAAGT